MVRWQRESFFRGDVSHVCVLLGIYLTEYKYVGLVKLLAHNLAFSPDLNLSDHVTHYLYHCS